MAHTIAHDSKGCVPFIVSVFRIEVVGFCFSNVPLSIGRIWILTTSHTDGAVDVRQVRVSLKRNGVSRSSVTALRICYRIKSDRRATRVATLNHEIIDDSMEEYAIINTIFDVGDHVLCGDWSPRFKQLNNNHAISARSEVRRDIRHFNLNNRIALIGVFHRGFFWVWALKPRCRIDPYIAPSAVAGVSMSQGHHRCSHAQKVQDEQASKSSFHGWASRSSPMNRAENVLPDP